MRFLSVCSGIEAASVAWSPLGWRASAFSEIERFPCQVLAHHYPHVPNRGDMTHFKDWPDDAIDLLCGGTPCQSFSVAGLRAGLDDPRGNLMLTYGAIAARYRPRWLVWENVPGVLSSNEGRDFGSFLGLLGQLGYGFAYRVLDAQHFGVPQRRRRVFVVACLGDWRAAAAVLFERHSLSGHPAPRREAGQNPAGTLSARTEGGGGLGTDFELGGGLIPEAVGALTAAHGPNGHGGSGLATDKGAESGHILAVAEQPYEVANCLTQRMYKGINTTLDEGQTPILAHSLRADGFDASEDGTGRGTPLVPIYTPDLAATMVARSSRGGGQTNSPGHHADHELIAFDTTQVTSAGNYSSPKLGDPCHPLAAGAHAPAIALQDVRGLDKKQNGAGWNDEGPSYTVDTHATQGVAYGMRVRRLTPRECERLQGFPDDYTLIPFGARKKIEAELLLYLRLTCPDLSMAEARQLAADGPRYKALGNSWAVPCAYWIGMRIALVDTLALPFQVPLQEVA